MIKTNSRVESFCDLITVNELAIIDQDFYTARPSNSTTTLPTSIYEHNDEYISETIYPVDCPMYKHRFSLSEEFGFSIAISTPFTVVATARTLHINMMPEVYISKEKVKELVSSATDSGRAEYSCGAMMDYIVCRDGRLVNVKLEFQYNRPCFYLHKCIVTIPKGNGDEYFAALNRWKHQVLNIK